MHGPEQASRHLQMINGTVFLHRETFVRDVERAFKAFRDDVFSDAELGGRLSVHFQRYPPLGLAILIPTAVSPAVSASVTNSATSAHVS
jgi:hypothetical protein